MRTVAATIKRALKHCVPECALLAYHCFFAIVALVLYRHPSRRLIVIGVTGTKGKTSTALYIHAALSAAGTRTGLLSTAEIRVGDTVHANARHMTMPGRGFVQRYLKTMADAGCTHAVIETPSEGIRQFRDLGVWYDAVVFTNLSPEHLVTHKTFERYRDTKCRLFRRHARSGVKKIRGTAVQRLVLINADDNNADYIAACASSRYETIRFGLGGRADVRARLYQDSTAVSFTVADEAYTVPYPGSLTVRNVLPAIILAQRYCGATAEQINHGIGSLTLPGRLERIDEGQSFRVFCDYAHEPLSIKSVCEALRAYAKPDGRVIVVVGGVGASRWRYNAEAIGEAAARSADIIVITDVDPFFDNPQEIIEAVAAGARRVERAKWHTEPDRRKAIHTAVAMARAGDVVIITGKGAEVTMEVRGKSLPWDERAIIRDVLRRVHSER